MGRLSRHPSQFHHQSVAAKPTNSKATKTTMPKKKTRGRAQEEDSKQKHTKKQKLSDANGKSRNSDEWVWRNGFYVNPRHSSLRLSFQDSWTDEYRAQALWIDFTIHSSPALTTALSHFCKNRNTTGRIGLEIKAHEPAICFIDGSDKSVSAPTDLKMEDLFPNTSHTWMQHLIALVNKNLLTMEISPPKTHRQPVKRQPITPVIEWHFGIAWRKYTELCHTHKATLPPTPSLRLALQKSMHRVMLWLVCRSVFRRGIHYFYWDELRVMYAEYVAPPTIDLDQNEKPVTKFDINEVYACIDAKQQLQRDVSNYDDAVKGNEQRHSNALLPTLRSYQKAAVSWMLARETTNVDQSNVPMQYCVTFTRPGDTSSDKPMTILYDPFCAYFHPPKSMQLDHYESLPPPTTTFSPIKGGILADEMGLGKTVEMIALILVNPSQLDHPMFQTQHFSTMSIDNDEEALQPTKACICGSSDDHHLGWITCDFCHTLHHQLCTGYNRKTSAYVTTATGKATPCDSFMCFHCHNHQHPLSTCKTTLIVSPESIHDQWELELTRHVKPGALTLMRYLGVKAIRSRLTGQTTRPETPKPSSEWQLLANPWHMASYDIVLTTYEALASDLHHLPNENGHHRRSSTRQKNKKYPFVASPLVFLEFWRVCMDEAQVGVENVHLQSALTVAELKTQRPWIVSGTPFSTHIGDLFGCFKFLRLEPFARDNGELFFRETIVKCFTKGVKGRVMRLLLWDGNKEYKAVGGGLLWRTSKQDVQDQLNIPTQSTEIVWCTFSKLERSFYDEQQEKIKASLRNQQREQEHSEGKASIVKLNDHVWNDLLVLRQLCCHPQVGKMFTATFGGRKTGKHRGDGGHGVLTMDEFLDELITKARRACIEAQRRFLTSQNDLAAILIIQQQHNTAIQTYMKSLNAIRTMWPLGHCDLVTLLHLVGNLACAIQWKVEEVCGVSMTSEAQDDAKEVTQLDFANNEFLSLPAIEQMLIDNKKIDPLAISKEYKQLISLASTIKNHYLMQVESVHTTALLHFQSLVSALNPQLIAQQKQEKSLSWMNALMVIEHHASSRQVTEMIDRLRARLLSINTSWTTSFCKKFTTLAGFRTALTKEWQQLLVERQALHDQLLKLSQQPPTEQDIAKSGNCGICRVGRVGAICRHCQLYPFVKGYHLHLLGVAPSYGNANKLDGEDNEVTVLNWPNQRSNSGAANRASVFRDIFMYITSTAGALVSSAEMQDIEQGLKTELDRLTLLQKEWNAANKLFIAQHERLARLDELATATQKICLQEPGEMVITARDRYYKIEEDEVDVRREQFELEGIAAAHDMQTTQAKLRYLLQLESEKQQKSDTKNNITASDSEANCLVCLETVGNDRGMLPCAHMFCWPCMTHLMQHQNEKTSEVKCPVCREVCASANVMHVNTGGQEEKTAKDQILADKHITLKRSGFGSKVDAILRRVVALTTANPNVKCLLFTQWLDMLTVVATALKLNDIRCFAYTTKKAFPALVDDFKVFDGPCVLAMPFKNGANGLNVVEATEVLLVEPLLTPAVEAQAINRVHRIGQTKPTRVHRFLVTRSVEERIYNLTQQRSSANKSTPDTEEKEQREGDTESTPHDRFTKKEEKERITLCDLDLLLNENDKESDPMDSSSTQKPINSTAVQVENEAEPMNADPHAFWLEYVIFQGKTYTRDQARQLLETEHNEQLKANNANNKKMLKKTKKDEPITYLFNKYVNIFVANDLMQLEYAIENKENEVRIETNVLKFHQSRLRVQCKVWKESN